MKTVLISIKPYWLFLIIAKTMGWKTDRQKTVEIRKSFPKDKDWDKTVILYCTKDKTSFNQIPKEYQPMMENLLGKVIGEFVCNEISKFTAEFVDGDYYEDIRYCYTTIDDEEDVIIISTNEDNNPNKNWLCKESCLSFDDVKKYIGVNFHEIPFYAWHISDLVIYDKPKELLEFIKPCIYGEESEIPCFTCNKSGYAPDMHITCFNSVKRPPQSWCYVRCEK